MLFSRRKKLENEYYKWLKEERDDGIVPSDCVFNVITFLAGRELLKEEEEPIDLKDINIHTGNALVDCPFRYFNLSSKRNPLPSGGG